MQPDNKHSKAPHLFRPQDAAKLRIAARLLRSETWLGGPVPIQPQDGENFMLCVQRVASSLPLEQKQYLKSLVMWVYDYETSGVPD